MGRLSSFSPRFPDIYPISSKKEAFIIDCWVVDQMTWDLDIRRRLFDRAIGSWVALLRKTDLFREGEGRVSWTVDSPGQFSLKLAFLKASDTPPLIKVILKFKVPMNVNFFF